MYCDGPGTATLTVDGTAKSLKGGKCASLGNTYTFSVGVSTNKFPEGVTKPDYLGIVINGSSTATATVAFVDHGKTDVVLAAKLKATSGFTSGTVSGTSMSGNKKVSVTFACN